MAGHRRDYQFRFLFMPFFISLKREEPAGVTPKQKWEASCRGRYRTAGHGLEKDAVWQQTSFRYHVFFLSQLLLSNFVLVAACPRARFSFLPSPFENLPSKNCSSCRSLRSSNRSVTFVSRKDGYASRHQMGFLFLFDAWFVWLIVLCLRLLQIYHLWVGWLEWWLSLVSLEDFVLSTRMTIRASETKRTPFPRLMLMKLEGNDMDGMMIHGWDLPWLDW
ncbi:hypothetical protein B0J13DRAFT_191962 [Dactylonectria estremocensis]|uniref:Transmembrane protein n=1 Tax=Dactylonectria estremocensis TaxID=1079267 RepID=A0A9P9JHL9_9HYPO|nr:hypothetical protein B0J13DRAFT_191962 [Dactylonectria estremocensis]